ncbi:MAG TPA: hypothetical protein VF794_35595 [Archangium sp.]|jgi:hypothetical protein|uniref:hypothetical protein n=1 Tax=Archangium sp. TaxID=1872627 RepID=UPI002EDB96A8
MKPLVRLGLLAVCLLALVSTSCSSGAGGAVAWGLAMAAVSRSQGGCYASCVPGTVCNKKTGYCDALPCRGECLPHEQCVEEGLSSRCTSGKVIVNPP